MSKTYPFTAAKIRAGRLSKAMAIGLTLGGALIMWGLDRAAGVSLGGTLGAFIGGSVGFATAWATGKF